MILQLKEIVALAKAFFIFFRCLFRLLIKSFCEQSWHLARKARGERDNALMVLFEDFHVHARSIIIPLGKSLADNLHQVGITRVIFC